MDNITLSDLEVKNTLDNSDKILIRDSNNVDKVIQGSAVESRITDALSNYGNLNIGLLTDCNVDNTPANKTSFYALGTNGLNAPESNKAWFIETSVNDSGTRKKQTAKQYYPITSNSIYSRIGELRNGSWTWSSWEKLVTTSEVPKKTKSLPYPYTVFESKIKSYWSTVSNGTQFVSIDLNGPACNAIFYKLNDNYGFVIGFGYYTSVFGLIFMQLNNGSWTDPVLLDMS